MQFGSIVMIIGSMVTQILKIDPNIMLKETNLKITGPMGIFWENPDFKTAIREPFANDLAPMLHE